MLQQTLAAWKKIFDLSAAVGLFGAIVYCIFFDGNEQPWNQYGLQEEDPQEETE